MQAVSSGIPPIAFDISTAIGVVTDFGINEVIIFQSECINFPRMKVVVIAVNAATINPKYTALLFFFKNGIIFRFSLQPSVKRRIELCIAVISHIGQSCVMTDYAVGNQQVQVEKQQIHQSRQLDRPGRLRGPEGVDDLLDAVLNRQGFSTLGQNRQSQLALPLRPAGAVRKSAIYPDKTVVS